MVSDLSYRRAVMDLNSTRREAGDILEQSYHVSDITYRHIHRKPHNLQKLAKDEQECLEKLQRVACLYGETAM